MNNKRIFAGVIDFLIAGLIQAVFMMVFLLIPLLNNTISITDVITRNIVITYSSVMFLVIRDIIGIKSIGKRILKLKIIENNSGNEAKFLKRLFRNVTWLLGPIEIIVLLITKNRIGDKIAGTAVVEV